MTDSVFRAFLQTAAEDAARVNKESDIVRLVPDPLSGDPPATYHGLFDNLEHFERKRGGVVQLTTGPIPFRIHFPESYCRSLDRDLGFHVASVRAPIVHPNVKTGTVCLGPNFRAGSRLLTVILQLYEILSGSIRATDHAFDLAGRAFFLDHAAEVDRLRSPPLWRRPIARSVAVGPNAKDQEHPEGGPS